MSTALTPQPDDQSLNPHNSLQDQIDTLAGNVKELFENHKTALDALAEDIKLLKQKVGL